MAKKEITAKKIKPRIPKHIKTAASTLSEHLSREVTPSKIGDEWVLKVVGDTPSKWKGVKVFGV